VRVISLAPALKLSPFGRFAIPPVAHLYRLEEAPMAKTMTVAAAIVTGASVLALHSGALARMGSAATPTQADFDLCNQEVALGNAGSASPRAGRSAGARGSTPGSIGVGSSASASVGAGAAAGGSTSGSTLDGGGPVTSGASSLSDPSHLRGMADQQAYRDCLKRKGF
jgi:hypothetical protein